MCTAIITFAPGERVVVAANRDEAYARDTGPPARIDGFRTSGTDRRAGGTWCGATDGGFLTLVTNFFVGKPADAAKRSRGDLVLGALRLGDPDATSDWIASLDGRDFNPFNLLFGDATRLRVAYGRPDEAVIKIDDVPAGTHILPNDVLDAPTSPRVARARELLASGADLRAVLADHACPICLHTDAYGTRSASRIELAPDRTERYLFAPGTLCVQDFLPWATSVP